MPRDSKSTGLPGPALSPLVYGRLTHLWQAARWNPALDAGYLGLDERSAADTLRQALLVAELLTYYDSDGTPNSAGKDPGWPDFLRDDPSFLLARISAYRPQETDKPETVLYDWYSEATRLRVLLPDGLVTQGLIAVIEAAVDTVNA